jgi:hypothetical protein
MISRRGFIGTLIGGVVAGAAVRTWPFRVYSFPSQVESAANFEDISLQLQSIQKQMSIQYEIDSTALKLIESRKNWIGCNSMRVPMKVQPKLAITGNITDNWKYD